ncbi:hypothetical protein [Aestuariispira insulae]|nr:hypothetical protein [Aestuariispira insulae]
MKEERETLLIDGLPTVELDFKSLHPRMLYHLQGLDAPEDCHQANGDYPREVIKGLCMRVLNTTDRSACIKSIDKMFTEEFDGVLKGQYNPKQLLSDYEDFHEPIRNLFYSEQWLRLQHLDSVMAQKIMSAFTRRGLPILGIHDSFIVQDRYEEDLRREMSLAYQSILQREPLITPYR